MPMKIPEEIMGSEGFIDVAPGAAALLYTQPGLSLFYAIPCFMAM